VKRLTLHFAGIEIQGVCTHVGEYHRLRSLVTSTSIAVDRMSWRGDSFITAPCSPAAPPIRPQRAQAVPLVPEMKLPRTFSYPTTPENRLLKIAGLRYRRQRSPDFRTSTTAGRLHLSRDWAVRRQKFSAQGVPHDRKVPVLGLRHIILEQSVVHVRVDRGRLQGAKNSGAPRTRSDKPPSAPTERSSGRATCRQAKSQRIHSLL